MVELGSERRSPGSHSGSLEHGEDLRLGLMGAEAQGAEASGVHWGREAGVGEAGGDFLTLE